MSRVVVHKTRIYASAFVLYVPSYLALYRETTARWSLSPGKTGCPCFLAQVTLDVSSPVWKSHAVMFEPAQLIVLHLYESEDTGQRSQVLERKTICLTILWNGRQLRLEAKQMVDHSWDSLVSNIQHVRMLCWHHSWYRYRYR